MKTFDSDIKAAVNVLREGGIILYPTDTIWGVGCDATNFEAVSKLYRLKKRPEDRSMLIFLKDINSIYGYVDDIPEVALDLIEIADKPTTVIFSNAKNLADNLTADDGSIGIRIPEDDFCQTLLRQFKKPIVSTSANFSGKPAPRMFSEISEEFRQKIDYIVEWRQEEKATISPSSIIKIEADSTIKIIRS